MVPPMTEIRPATAGEMSHAVAAIVAAFLTDPLARFAWPSPDEYFRAMPQAVRAFANASIEHGTAYVSGNFCGTAIWLPPGVHPDGEALERLLSSTATPGHREDVLATFAEMERSHPDQPH